MIVHAGLIARRVNGRWLGALIQGSAGSGKSDLALRALSVGFRLVSDDRVRVFASEGRLYGRAPDALAGLIEVRGLGVIPREHLAFVRVALCVRCAPAPDHVERMPDLASAPILGVATPTADLWPFEASAPAKLAAMLEHLGARAQERYQAGSASPGGRVGG